MTSSNGNIFRVTGPCAGNSLITDEFALQRPVTRSFDVFFELCLNKRLSTNHEAGDLRRHRAHYDVTVMAMIPWVFPIDNMWIWAASVCPLDIYNDIIS